MRRIFVFMLALFVLCAVGSAYAQLHISVNFNLNTQPAWGPVGYDYVDYYFLPDIDVYYSVPLHLFYFYDEGRWISRERLPERYHDYDLYRSYKVVVNERDPWRHNRYFREKYSSDRDRHDQEVIRDSRDPRYFINKHHPMHKEWLKEHRDDRGRDHGRHEGRDKRDEDRHDH